MDDVERGVRDIVIGIARKAGPELRGDTDLRVELGVDSLQGLQIMAAIERRFGVEVPDEDLDDYDTVDAIVAKVRALRDQG